MSKARDLANAGTALGAVTATELGYVDGVTSAIQTQIDSKIGQSTAINPTIVDAKGDIIAATAADTVARLAVGANDTVLTADSSTATGLKWAAPASGGMTLISTTTLSGSSITLSSIPQTYNNLQLIVRNYKPASDANLWMRVNGITTNSYFGSESLTYYSTNSVGSASLYSYMDVSAYRDSDSVTSRSNYVIDIYDYKNTVTWKNVRCNFVKTSDTGNDQYVGFWGGFFAANNAIDSITFLNSTGNFTSGEVLLYGVK